LAEDTAQLIAERVPGNVRDLEGALYTLLATSRFTHQPVSNQLAMTALRDLMTVHERMVSIPNIQKTVAEFFSIKTADLLGKSRVAKLVLARQFAMALAKELTRHSLAHIGDAFQRDHTTVIHAYQKLEGLRKTDGAIREQWDKLLRLLTA
jgi:chromosomal replication initiator protein